MVVPWIWVSISNSQVIWQKAKKDLFLHFLCPSQKKFQVAANRTLSKIDALPIAHFEDNVPNFSKHMLKLAIPSKIWVSDPPKVSWSEFVSLNDALMRGCIAHRSLYCARIFQHYFAIHGQCKNVCDLPGLPFCICVFVFVYCKCIVYCQCKTVCDLRLLSRLSDLNGQIPSPLSQTFLTHDDDGHHDVGHHDDNEDGDGDNEAKIIQLWQDPWFDLRQKIGIKATAAINWTSSCWLV